MTPDAAVGYNARMRTITHVPTAIPATAPVLCVHFTSDRGDYSLSLLDPDSDGADLTPFRNVDVTWRRRANGLRWGEVSFRGTVACEAVLLDSRDTACHHECRLDAEGVSRRCAAVLSRLHERPLLATFARGPELSPDMLRRTQRLLVGMARGLVQYAAESNACEDAAARPAAHPSAARHASACAAA